jgi:hypothetical protein
MCPNERIKTMTWVTWCWIAGDTGVFGLADPWITSGYRMNSGRTLLVDPAGMAPRPASDCTLCTVSITEASRPAYATRTRLTWQGTIKSSPGVQKEQPD